MKTVFFLKSKNISILGCGWLGLPLAAALIDLGYNIKGATTSRPKLKTLEIKGIQPFLIQLNEEKVQGNIQNFLKDSNTLILNVPPGLRKNPKKSHVAEIKKLIYHIEKSTIKNALFISSTSVFKDDVSIPKITKNTTPNGTSNSAKQLIEIEHLLRNNSKINATILRFSGLFDDQRHPGKFLSGRENISNPEAPVNLIHKEDCMAIILGIIAQKLWNISLNASFPYHPKKEDYYTNYCKANQLALPKFDKKKSSEGKIIEGKNVAQLLKYNYKLSL